MTPYSMAESLQRTVGPMAVQQHGLLAPMSRTRRFRDLIDRFLVTGGDLLLEVPTGEGFGPRLCGRHWNSLAQNDALKSILTLAGDDTSWDLDGFFETGRADIERLMADIERLMPSLPKRRALDFGCGVGRLTQALKSHFDEVIGVDRAASMIALAQEYDRSSAKCEFVINRRPHLRRFTGNTFDLVYSRLVLQHIPPTQIKRYIQELLRLLAPGGLFVFQLPTAINDPRQAFCNAPVLGGQLKLSLPGWLVHSYRQVKYHVYRSVVPHMEMFGMARETVVDLVEGCDGQIVEIRADRSHGTSEPGFEYWVTKRAAR